jgi:hypothetical protein
MGWELFGWKFIGTHLPALLLGLGAAVMAIVSPDTRLPAYLLLLIMAGVGIIAGQTDAAILRRLERLEQARAEDVAPAQSGRR